MCLLSFLFKSFRGIPCNCFVIFYISDYNRSQTDERIIPDFALVTNSCACNVCIFSHLNAAIQSARSGQRRILFYMHIVGNMR